MQAAEEDLYKNINQYTKSGSAPIKAAGRGENTGYEIGSMSIIKGAKNMDEAPDLSSIRLIDYDFKKYGSSEEHKRLLKKWDDEVSSLPQ